MESQGVAAGVDNLAVNAAIDNAVTSMVVDELERNWKTKQLSAFKPIIERASSYVRSIQINDCESGDGTTWVKISGKLDDNKLLQDSAVLALRKMRNKPRIIIISTKVTNDNPGKLPEETPTEKELVHQFEEQGFEILSSPNILQLYTTEELIAHLQPENDNLSRLAKENLASVVIRLNIKESSTPAAAQSNIFRNAVDLSVEIIPAKGDGEKHFLTAQAVVNSQETTTGLEQAALDALAKLRNDIWVKTIICLKQDNDTSEIVVEIPENVEQEVADALLRKLTDTGQVPHAEVLMLNQQLCRLLVVWNGPVADLVTFLTNRSFSEKRFYAKSVIGNVITLFSEDRT